MEIDFNGETITVEIPDGFYPTDAVLIVRAQSLSDSAAEYLAVGSTPSTGGIMQHGILSMASSPDAYTMIDVYDDEDDD